MTTRLNVKAHNTPTSATITNIVIALGGGQLASGQGQIASLCAKDSSGVSLGCVAVTTSDWINQTINKTITIQTAGTVSYLSLDDSGGEELYTYTLPNPQSVNPNDVIDVTWTISWTNVQNTGNIQGIIQFIIGDQSDIAIVKVVYKNAGAVVYNDSAPSVSYDTTTQTVTVTSTVDNSGGTSDLTFDAIEFQSSTGIAVVEASVSGTVVAGSSQTFTFNIKPRIG